MPSLDPLVTQLVEARKAAGLSQAAVAEAAGTTQQYLSHVERGRNDPTVGWCRRVAQALGLQPGPLVSLAYSTTAPAVESPAGNGAPELFPESAPAEPGPVSSRPGAVAQCERCEGTRTEGLRWVGPGAGDWRPIVCTSCSPVLRTLDVAEATVALASSRRIRPVQEAQDLIDGAGAEFL